MRVARVACTLGFVGLLTACAETPRCVDRGTPDRPNVVVTCNADKVPVCGNDPEALYDDRGALRPVPPPSVASGSCEGLGANCRTRPVCGQAGEAPTCADGNAPTCVLGAVREITPPRPDSGPAPMPDAGPDEQDAGSEDDAGSDEDAGVTTDAG